MTTPPTARQLEVHAFMLSFKAQHEMWPTVREICKAFRFASTNAAFEVLQVLKRKGLARHRVKCARGWIAIEVA